MQLTGLLSLLREAQPFSALIDQIRDGQPTADQRLLRSARPYAVAALRSTLNRPILVVTSRVERAYNVAEQLPAWLPDTPVLRFAEPNSLFYERSPWAINTVRARLSVLASLVTPIGGNAPSTPSVIVTSALALMQKTMPVREFRAATRMLKSGDQTDPEKLLRTWLGIGYTPASIVTDPGTFSRRGGIVDIYPIQSNRPIRIEFFGDEIESIREFDPATQRSADEIASAMIVPARETLPKFSRSVADRLAGWFDSLPTAEEDITSPLPDREELRSESAFPLMEFYLPYFYSQPASLLDYLPENTLVVVEDWQTLNEAIADLETQAIAQHDEKKAGNSIPADMPLPYLTWDELHEEIDALRPLHFGGIGYNDEPDGDEPDTRPDPHDTDDESPRIGALFVPAIRFGGQLKNFMDSVRKIERGGELPIVVSNQARRLCELWNERGYQSNTALDLPELPGKLVFVEGALAEGWTFRGSPTHLFTDAEVFGWKRPEPRRRHIPRAVSPEAYFADMSPGDYVVHIEYGIGRFVGLRKTEIDGSEREFLVIQFAGTDTLHVPIDQADRITRFIGVEGQEPALSKLGTPDWHKTKEAARAAAEQVARELLDLYAKRETVVGHAFTPDTPWQAELEASFPYIETEDQLRVLSEVKADMESERPMDRLLCGDVGYGKTEIALRAAFKAVMDSKQVAILVPTTVLAQQHWTTFSQRLAAFPIRVDMLSRFRTKAEQNDILEKVEKGEIDIIIGTHRLLGRDVRFKDLGLLVIDEEQRFGVTHKERLKQMRTEVDVLTMTATPIPRTLYMSLAGIRDISMLQTAPEERLPVLTHVGPHDDKLVRTAILRELDRGGQVFYVHNRVNTIDSFAKKLEQIVPEASYTIGHGQMPEDELELVMQEFATGRFDVLLCTTIIESGLDIPNANTIIIDQADTFGLAQLHQLRGRVGRGVHRGYAYMFYHAGHLNPDARARLDTIAEQTELGAGFSIAMRDLEIRGTGDLLGTKQSGYIAAVGFNLYTQLLAQAVTRLKTGQRAVPSGGKSILGYSGPVVTVDLPVPAYIPTDFVPEMPVRLQLYRRVADLDSIDALNEMHAELQDRFGTLPDEVNGLLYQIRVKLLAIRAGATAVSGTGDQVIIKMPNLANIDRMALQVYLRNGARVSRTGVFIPKDEGDTPSWQDRLIAVLERLQSDPVRAS